ncbi:glucosamine-6-phosphate deaminase [Humibacter ginsenosidimutans]|uniref:Glucosamine-6-phosphate deaminase n=1 Tax=Humibacter ginsenosidimutans TaxID=2599293 RepID=A0A5B8M4U4_9MICO|nr:glucosamine-6-phosphate deaminase [Humibacter ginsenosidimutans]QDZ14825.1 glucosamine-6-phosphate deaminase [Humibacter ginsenosidimutans]
MEVVIKQTADEVGALAAELIGRVVESKPRAVIGLATGSSPLAIYADLARRVADGTLDFDGVRGFALDEYVGIPEEHPQSYASVIRTEVVEPLRMDPTLVRVPDGRAIDIEVACRDYEQAIADAGGIDVQILGIGANGHIGFNEPTSSFASRTRIKTLAPTTRADNARFFDSLDEVPTHCVTQGLGTIMNARRLVLVAQGAGKADAIAAAVEGPVSSMCPASVLQFHEHATVIIDEAAASKLRLADYYTYTYDNKPSWQL